MPEIPEDDESRISVSMKRTSRDMMQMGQSPGQSQRSKAHNSPDGVAGDPYSRSYLSSRKHSETK